MSWYMMHDAWWKNCVDIYYFLSLKKILLKKIVMKVVYPKNIKKWLLAGMTFNIWPLSISIVQLVVLALGVALALVTFNTVAKSWSKVLWLLFAVIILIVFLVIAFFKVSELWLLAYVAKLIRNWFFDAKKKRQVNYEKHNSIDILIEQAKIQEEKRTIEQKDKRFDTNKIKDIEKKWLI